eukprot:TRINITY_DN19210_c0_g1_i1.p1 TRINITY_DN19210_c0_g1~~TRINITY_DN19210_c0_g1_i1.p1  ORF type:complete len:834 (+),score=70.52 TRINITY_DN19210_c0_g1_i1:281-2782(+)
MAGGFRITPRKVLSTGKDPEYLELITLLTKLRLPASLKKHEAEEWGIRVFKKWIEDTIEFVKPAEHQEGGKLVLEKRNSNKSMQSTLTVESEYDESRKGSAYDKLCKSFQLIQGMSIMESVTDGGSICGFSSVASRKLSRKTTNLSSSSRLTSPLNPNSSMKKDADNQEVSEQNPEKPNRSELEFLNNRRPSIDLFHWKTMKYETHEQTVAVKNRNRRLLVWTSVASVVYIVFIVNLLLIPLAISFPVEISLSVPILLDITAFLLILAKFQTPFQYRGMYIDDLFFIRRRYLACEFWFDLFACFPLYAVVWAFIDSNRQLVGYYRLNRLLFCTYLPSYTTVVCEFIKPTIHPLWVRLARLLLVFIGAVHIVTCGMRLVLGRNEAQGLIWLRRSDYWEINSWHQYIAAMDWCLRELFGRGVYIPMYDAQVIWSTWVVMGGLGMLTTLLATVNDSVQSLDRTQSMLPTKLDAVKDEMQHLSLTPAFQAEAVRFYRNMWNTCKSFSEEAADAIFEGLPIDLYEALQSASTMALICSIPLFRNINNNMAFVKSMYDSLTPIVTVPNEPVCIQGEICDDVYFVVRGVLELMNEGEEMGLVHEGECFGEDSMLFGEPVEFSIIARQHCRLYSINRENFERLVDEFPEALFEVLEMVVIRKLEKQKQYGKAASFKRAKSLGQLTHTMIPQVHVTLENALERDNKDYPNGDQPFKDLMHMPTNTDFGESLPNVSPAASVRGGSCYGDESNSHCSADSFVSQVNTLFAKYKGRGSVSSPSKRQFSAGLLKSAAMENSMQGLNILLPDANHEPRRDTPPEYFKLSGAINVVSQELESNASGSE